jgi:AcrR family transcriptional regulator
MDSKNNFFGGERRGYHHGRLKDALLEAARTLVAERGPAGFTLAEAAKRVGVTGAAPYRHFADRNDLMSELARRGFEMFGNRLEAAWDNGAPDPVTAASRMGAAYQEFARAEPGLYSAMFANARTLANPEPGAAADKALETLRKATTAILRAYGAPESGARALAFEIWALSHGVAMLTLAGHLTPEHDGCHPAEVMQGAANSLFESAIRRALGAPGNPPPAPPVSFLQADTQGIISPLVPLEPLSSRREKI